MSYSFDLRKRVVEYVLGGGQVTQAAELFGVHRQTVQNWMRMEKTEGLRAAGKPGPKGGRKVTQEALRQAVSDRSDARLKELGATLNVHPSTVFYACRKWGLSRKKNVGLQRAR